jgi:RNA polymerase sigma factor (sigma-70 family)
MAAQSDDDGKLLRQWLDHGEEAAFRLLVDRYAGLVYHAAHRTAAHPATAAEGAQLTFILLARKARKLQSRTSLAGWLHETAILQTRNLLRKQHREDRKLTAFTAFTAMTPDPLADHSQAWREMSPVLDEALAALPEPDREAILLRFYRSLTFPEIAATIGIATEAARKRVDRAVERLRIQLAHRGCQLAPAACIGALAQLGAEAKAATLFSTTLASQALAATTATTLSATSIAILMTKKTAITAGVAVLIAGAGAVALINSNSSDPAAPATASDTRAPGSASRTPFGEPTADAPARPRPRDPATELAAQYGDSRTNLSKHVASTVISLLEDAIEMGEMATTGELAGALGGPRGAMQAGLGGVLRDLNLSEEQRKQAESAYAEFQKRELERTRSAVDNLRKNPESLMRVMLASDAFVRGELSEDQYKAIQTSAQEDLEGVLNPLDRRNFQGGRPLNDETFRQEMLGVLDPSQAESFQSAVDARAARETPTTGSIAEMPAMDLEQLDKTITSAKTVTAGVRQMMEGLGGLQDLGPILEQQRRAQEQRQGDQ